MKKLDMKTYAILILALCLLNAIILITILLDRQNQEQNKETTPQATHAERKSAFMTIGYQAYGYITKEQKPIGYYAYDWLPKKENKYDDSLVIVYREWENGNGAYYTRHKDSIQSGEIIVKPIATADPQQ